MNLEEIKITNASGIYSSSISSLKDWIDAGVDGVVLKTTTFDSRKGYDYPNCAVDGNNLVQAMGLPNPGYKETTKIAGQIKEERPEVFVIGSLASGDSNELLKMLFFMESSVDAVELNISCPHVGNLGSSVGYDFDVLENLCDTAKENFDKPFGLKLPYYPNDDFLDDFLDVTYHVDFYTCMNSVGKSMMVGEDFGVSNKLGGLSGPCMKPLSVGQVYRIKKIKDKFIFGCGGIVDRKDVAEYLKVGANGIQLGSGIRFHETKKDFVDEARKGFNHKIKNYFEFGGIEDWD